MAIDRTPFEVPSFIRPVKRVRRRPKASVIIAIIAICIVLAAMSGWLIGLRKSVTGPAQISAPVTTGPASPLPSPLVKPAAPSKTPVRPKSASRASTVPAAEPEAEVVTWIRGDAGTAAKPDETENPNAPPVVGVVETESKLAAIPTGSPPTPDAPLRPSESTRPAEKSDGPLRVTPQVMLERAVVRPTPEYPTEARRVGAAGRVDLLVVIGADGKVEMAAPVSGPPVLGVAAAKTLKQWRFRPYQREGKPIRVETTISVMFRRQ